MRTPDESLHFPTFLSHPIICQFYLEIFLYVHFFCSLRLTSLTFSYVFFHCEAAEVSGDSWKQRLNKYLT